MKDQQGDKRGPSAVAADEQRRQGFDPAASAGLFVGVSRFERDSFAEVPFAVDDAVDLAYLFSEELGLLLAQKVVLALSGEAKKEETREKLQRLVAAGARVVGAELSDVYHWLHEVGQEAGPAGLLVVSMATHGFSDQGGDYLIAARTLRDLPTATGVLVNLLFDRISGSPCPRRLVLLDACRERLESARSVRAPAMAPSFAAAIEAATGQVVLSGSTLGGYAYDDIERGNGVFTAAVLDGLRGAAPLDERGFITARTLGDFVQQRVVEWVRRYRPEDAEVSTGIARRVEGAAEALPLAVNPKQRKAVERYRGRREAALAELRQNLGAVLSGALYDQVVALLPVEGAGEAAEELLEEIEALDGGVRSRRNLRDYLREQVEKRATETSTEAAAEKLEALDQQEVDAVGRGETVTVTRRVPAEAAKWSLGRLARSGAFIAFMSTAGLVYFLSTDGLRGLVQRMVVAILLNEKPILEASGESMFDDAPATTGSAEPSAPEAGTPLDGPLGMRFHFVPADTYWIGSPGAPEEEPGRYDTETRHQVKLTRGFWLAETEVTQAQWSALARNPSSFRACGENCPVENVSWFDAVTYANLLSDHDDLEHCYEGCKGTPGSESDPYTCEDVTFVGLDCPGYRLPTEAEWEVAARAGTKTAIYTGKLTLRGHRDGPELDPIAWYGGNSGVSYEGGDDCSDWPERQHDEKDSCGTHPVGQKPANTWGLHDMLGNVWEWTWDRHADYRGGMEKDPLGPDQGAGRVFRGGSWLSGARHVRAACRRWFHPGPHSDTLGFRLARGQGPPEEAGRSPE